MTSGITSRAHVGLERARGLAAVREAEVLAVERQHDRPARGAAHDAQRGLVGLGPGGQEHDAVGALRADRQQLLGRLDALGRVAGARPARDAVLTPCVAFTTSTISGWQLPMLLVPQPAPKSMKRLPSTSSIREPWALFAMKRALVPVAVGAVGEHLRARAPSAGGSRARAARCGSAGPCVVVGMPGIIGRGRVGHNRRRISSRASTRAAHNAGRDARDVAPSKRLCYWLAPRTRAADGAARGPPRGRRRHRRRRLHGPLDGAPPEGARAAAWTSPSSSRAPRPMARAAATRGCWARRSTTPTSWPSPTSAARRRSAWRCSAARTWPRC